MKKMLTVFLCALLVMAMPMAVFAVPEETEDTTIEISVVMELQSDNTVRATLYDDRDGVVSHWPVSLEIDGEVVERQDTDGNGDVHFEYVVGVEDAQIGCIADDGAFDKYTFVGGAVYLDDTMGAPSQNVTSDSSAIPTEPEETITTTTAVPVDAEPMKDTPISTTDSFSFAPMTTAVSGTLVGVGVDVDNGIVNAMQTPATEITGKSCMWMEKAQYDALVSSPDAMVHLQLTINADAAPKTALIAAKNDDPNFSDYEDAQVKGFAMDMNLMYIEGDSRVVLEPTTDGLYTVELPIPAVLSRSEVYAIAVCTVDGVDSFLQLTPIDGMLKFSVKRFQTLALVGFGDTGAVGSVAQTPWMLIVLGGVGAVLVIGGVLLLLLVTFRRRKRKISPEKANDEKDVTRKVMIEPTADVVIESSLNVPKDVVDKPVLLNYDEQSDLDEEEWERFRAKPNLDQDTFDRIATETVTPAEQISRDQRATIQKERDALNESSLNDMLDELIDDIDADRI